MNPIFIKTIDRFKIACVIGKDLGSDIVIWMHGLLEDKDEYGDFHKDGAGFLELHGFTSVRFDFRGNGQSSGGPADFSPIGQNLDVSAIIDFLLKRFGNTRRYHLIGTSFGAPPAIVAAKRYEQYIHKLFLIAPVISYARTFLIPETSWGADIFSDSNLRRYEKTGRFFLDNGYAVGPRFVEEIRVIHPEVLLREVTQEVMIMHGDGDSMVPHAVSVDASKELANVKLKTMIGVDHGFMVVGDEKGTSKPSQENKKEIFLEILAHIK